MIWSPSAPLDPHAERLAAEALAAPWWARFAVALRFVVLCQSSLTAWLLLNADSVNSLTGNAGRGDALIGHFALAGLVVLGWLDMLVNDLPHRWHMKSVRLRRLAIFSGIGMLYMVEAFVALDSSSNGVGALAIYYIGAGIGCAWTAALQAVRSEAASV